MTLPCADWRAVLVGAACRVGGRPAAEAAAAAGARVVRVRPVAVRRSRRVTAARGGVAHPPSDRARSDVLHVERRRDGARRRARRDRVAMGPAEQEVRAPDRVHGLVDERRVALEQRRPDGDLEAQRLGERDQLGLAAAVPVQIRLRQPRRVRRGRLAEDLLADVVREVGHEVRAAPPQGLRRPRAPDAARRPVLELERRRDGGEGRVVVAVRAPQADARDFWVARRRARDDDGRRVLGLLGHGSYSLVIVRAARGPWCERGSLAGGGAGPSVDEHGFGAREVP